MPPLSCPKTPTTHEDQKARLQTADGKIYGYSQEAIAFVEAKYCCPMCQDYVTCGAKLGSSYEVDKKAEDNNGNLQLQIPQAKLIFIHNKLGC